MGENLLIHKDPQLRQAAVRTFEEASDTLHEDFSRLCLTDPEGKLDRTIYTQPALLLVSIAALRMLELQGRRPDVVAGHSLGEYSALVAAEALSFEQGLRLVRARGEYMEEAGETNPGRMAAVLKLPLEQIKEICEESGAEIANINSEQQIVIAGKHDAVEYATQLATDKKGRVIGLNVSIASHCSLMEPARQRMDFLLQSFPFGDPVIPFVANISGNYIDTSQEVKRGLVDQLTGSVRWLDTMKLLERRGVESYVEVGSGEVLSGLLRRSISNAVISSADKIFTS